MGPHDRRPDPRDSSPAGREKLKVDAPLDGDLADHLDSIQRLTLVVAIEDHFEICFDESDEAEITDSTIWCARFVQAGEG